MTFDPQKSLVCNLCELLIVNHDEIKETILLAKAYRDSGYSMCPACGQEAVDPRNSIWCQKIDNWFSYSGRMIT
jgi:hypothetical protein